MILARWDFWAEVIRPLPLAKKPDDGPMDYCLI